jgi:hypothetical protein
VQSYLSVWSKLESLNSLKINEIAEKTADNDIVVWAGSFNHSNLKIQRFQFSQRPQRFNGAKFAPKVKYMWPVASFA